MQAYTRRLITLAAGLVAAVLASAPLAAQAAATYVVDDDGAQCAAAAYTGVAGLQNAVNDAITNHVHIIQVCAGTYSNVVVSGANGLKIAAQDPANRPLVNAPATDGGIVIDVENSKSVVLDGLSLSGDGFVDAGVGAMAGVLYHNSTGAVQNNVIYGIRSFPNFSTGTGRAVSLIDDDDNNKTSNVKVSGNYINTYQSSGIYAEGRVKPTLTGNTVQGLDHPVLLSSDVPGAGIELVGNGGHGVPSGTIAKNYVYYNLTNIALRTVSKNTISGNVIDFASVGVVIEANCAGPGQSADKNRFTGNTFLRMSNGAMLIAAITTVSSPCASHINQLTISGNEIHAYADPKPLAIGGGVSSSGPFAAQIDKVQISGNTVFGFTDLWSLPGATHVKDKKNKVYHL